MKILTIMWSGEIQTPVPTCESRCPSPVRSKFQFVLMIAVAVLITGCVGTRDDRKTVLTTISIADRSTEVQVLKAVPGIVRSSEQVILRGRDLVARDFESGALPVAVISERTQTEISQFMDVVGETVVVNGKDYVVVGIAADADRALVWIPDQP